MLKGSGYKTSRFHEVDLHRNRRKHAAHLGKVYKKPTHQQAMCMNTNMIIWKVTQQQRSAPESMFRSTR